MKPFGVIVQGKEFITKNFNDLNYIMKYFSGW